MMICTDRHKVIKMERIIKEERPYEQAFVEANEDRDILGGVIAPDEIAQKVNYPRLKARGLVPDQPMLCSVWSYQ